MANILAEPLHELADHFATLVKPNGLLVLSGVLSDQVDALQESYQRWFEMDEPVIQQDWARLSGYRKT